MSTEEKKNSQISLDSETLSPSTEKEVSEIVTSVVVPTCVVRAESEKSLIFKVSVPSVLPSLLRRWKSD